MSTHGCVAWRVPRISNTQSAINSTPQRNWTVKELVDKDNSYYPKKPYEGDYQDLTGQRARKGEWLLYTTLVKRTESEHD